MVNQVCTDLETKIKDKSARVCIIGLGYVGLPLATGFARCGYDVAGLDLDETKVSALKQTDFHIQKLV